MAPTETLTTEEVQLDVGELYVAPIGTTEPASPTAALDAAWREVGLTEDGSVFKTNVTSEKVEVAELLPPVRYVNTGRESTLEFKMAQMSRRNLALALNVGANATNDLSEIGPPDASEEVRVMILWRAANQSLPGVIQLIARQAYNTGGLEISNAKAPAKQLIPVVFSLEKPESADEFGYWARPST